MSTKRLTIFDTTLRDGEQAPGFSLRTDEKLTMARQLAALGVDVIEAGFPIASEADAESVRLVATDLRGPIIAGLARCTPADIDRAGWALEPAPRRRIHVFIATSDLHLETQAPDVARGLPGCRRRRGPSRATLHRRHPVLGGGRDAKRHGLPVPRRRRGHLGGMHDSQPAGHRRASRRRKRSATFFRTILSRVSNARHATFSTHCHDDLGLAVANTLAAVSAGATQVECTINGVGERAGNASLEEVVMATRVRSDLLPFETRIETREIYPSSQLLTALTGESVQSNKAIVGRNAFAHEAGIHQDGMLKDRRTYEIMRPEEVGVPQATLVLGKHSGRHAVLRRCEQLGTSVDRHELDRIYKAVIELADREKVVSDNDLAAIVQRVRSGAPHAVPVHSSPDFASTPAETGYGHGV